MSADPTTADRALTGRFLRDHPVEAARSVEQLPLDSAAEMLAYHPVGVLTGLFDHLTPFVAARMLDQVPAEVATETLAAMQPAAAAAALAQLEDERRDAWLASLNPAIADELRSLLEYPPDSAGRLMSRRLGFFRPDMAVPEASQRLRELAVQDARTLFLVDDEGRLAGRVSVQRLVTAPLNATLGDLAEPAHDRVDAIALRSELVEMLTRTGLTDIPVVDFAGRLLGAVPESALLAAVQLDAAGDLQAMVGVSRDERALSKYGFAVRKRLPWMQINLLTAFLAAAVVGLFEETIATYTALAVLLPVVAGQSGNAGAQALAVTMRGLALREITTRHALTLVAKELRVGVINGIAVALTTAAGVYVWSGSWGLALIISIAMTISMTMACLAGALVPIALQRMGQDPATSSSIILTTVTDVAGFFSFLGIATLFAVLL
jgi:magnesium transporter